MSLDKRYAADAEAILSHRGDNGADLWATPDSNIGKGAPFSTLECVRMLLELGVSLDDPVLTQAADLIFSVWREDGRFKVHPKSGMLPCHTTTAAATLCQMGYACDPRMEKTLQYLLDIQYGDGGWRCNKFSFGRGPETECSNPYPTLAALDAFRHHPALGREKALEQAAEFLLAHWNDSQAHRPVPLRHRHAFYAGGIPHARL